MTERLPDDRAEQAARTWFAQQASAAPGQIDPVAIRAAASRRQRLRFTGVLAVAAVLLAVLVIVPLALRPANPPVTGIPAPSVSEPTWTATSSPPLSPRFGSLTAWLDGRFYILGGWGGGDGGPCPPGSTCDMKIPNLRDGAAYDPTTDSWTTIAEAPITIGQEFSAVVVLQGVLYLADRFDDGSFWAYHPDADEWQALARPPGFRQMVATSAMIVVNTYDDNIVHQAYRPSEDAWARLPDGPIDSCYGLSAWAVGERVLVLGRCGADDTELRTSFYDPGTDQWSQARAIPDVVAEPTAGYDDEEAVYVAGALIWPDSLAADSPMPKPGIFDIATGTWRDVSAADSSGGLSFRGMPAPVTPAVLEGLGLVEANGNLLDVRTSTWVTVPEAPEPDRWDPVVASGPDSLLSCFGYLYSDDSFDGGRFAPGCQLLTLGSIDPPSPTGTPTPTSPTGTPTPVSPTGSATPVSPTEVPGKVFRGTLQEYNDARMACVAGYGLTVVPGDPNDLPSFGVSAEGVGQDRVDEVLALCDEEVGVLYTPPATEASMTDEYEWLVGQYECLVAAGFPAAEPPPLEVVLDRWRTGGHSTYDPMATLLDQYDAALAACPRTTAEWPRQ